MSTTSHEPAPAAEPQATKPLLTGPKRQHFLPRFYLENFSVNGLVAVYDREQDVVRLQQPVNTGVIGHFYTMEDAEGRKRFELEQFLSEYEGKAKPVIESSRHVRTSTPMSAPTWQSLLHSPPPVRRTSSTR